MKRHQSTIGENDEWLTPRWILEPLGLFDLDPACARVMPWQTANIQWSENGLRDEWAGRVWLNPPFNRYIRPLWMKRMAAHGNGIMLVPAATETEAFDQWVWKQASGVCFVKTRPHFAYVDGTESKANCGCSIALVGYGHANADVLRRSGLGTTIFLANTEMRGSRKVNL